MTIFAPTGILLWALLAALLAVLVHGAVFHSPAAPICTLFIVLYLIFYCFLYYVGFVREKRLIIESLQKLFADTKPVWDNQAGTLSYGGIAVRHFRRPSSDHWRILDAFEQQGWPPRIDDPLPETADGDRPQRLAEAVQFLNGNEELSFQVDETGGGAFWAPRCSTRS
jgi:hypothetical protein